MKKLKILTLVATMFFAQNILLAQHLNVLIGNTLSGNEPEEPSIAINPNNPNEMVAGANIDNVYISTDGGYNWNHSVLTSNQNGVFGDPCIVPDNQGNFYYFHLANPPAGNWIDRIVCQKLETINGNWSEGTFMGLNEAKAQDKEWAIVNFQNNNIYVTWTQFDVYGSSDPLHKSNIMFSRSDDGGQTWTVAKKINQFDGDCIDDDNTLEGAVPAVGVNGEIYVSWSGPQGIVFDKSLDNGETWLDEDIFVSEHIGGWAINIPGIMRCNGMPVTVCDTSSNSPHKGTIYINWADQRNGADDTDIWLSKSTDGGNTWTNAVRVNNDPPGKHQFFTWMTVDQITGNLWFVFYDRREHDDEYTDVYLAISRDGGETFENFKISETPFYPYESVFFGDYTNIVAHNNIIRPIWARLDQSQLSVWTAIVNPLATNVNNEDFSSIVLEQNAPNPFNASTFFSYKIKKATKVSLEVRDLYGKTIARLINNEFQQRGKYVKQFYPEHYNLQSGIYYFSLITDNKTITKKMIFIK